jgi:putative PIN family toxin of toxin-antitoxin system
VRVFLDTNVLVAAMATRGLCSDVLRHVLAEHEWVASRQVVTELRRALRDKLRLSASRIDDIEQFVEQQVVMAETGPLPSGLRLRQTADMDILAAAIAAGADVLVTGDAEILALEFPGPPELCSPREFWNRMTGN